MRKRRLAACPQLLRGSSSWKGPGVWGRGEGAGWVVLSNGNHSTGLTPSKLTTVKPSLLPLLAPLLALLSACHPADKTATTQAEMPPAQTSPAQTQALPRTDPQSGLPWMTVSDLPAEGQRVYALIGKGGPFRYSKDGSVFGNREGILPAQPRNYYREYTVKTPGERDRGARRIICGGQPVTSRADCYYTADHYASFRRIRP